MTDRLHHINLVLGSLAPGVRVVALPGKDRTCSWCGRSWMAHLTDMNTTTAKFRTAVAELF
eukprot:scaffold200630_cov18-Prasinocladus_malaysianus.AAC.1